MKNIPYNPFIFETPSDTRKLSVKKQMEVLDFFYTKLPKDFTITWNNTNIYDWGINIHNKTINIPRPKTVDGIHTLFHELGHIKFYQFTTTDHYSHTQVKKEHFADWYSFQILKYFKIPFNNALRFERQANISYYAERNGESYLNYPLDNFSIIPIHLL